MIGRQNLHCPQQRSHTEAGFKRSAKRLYPDAAYYACTRNSSDCLDVWTALIDRKCRPRMCKGVARCPTRGKLFPTLQTPLWRGRAGWAWPRRWGCSWGPEPAPGRLGTPSSPPRLRRAGRKEQGWPAGNQSQVQHSSLVILSSKQKYLQSYEHFMSVKTQQDNEYFYQTKANFCNWT